MEKMNARKKAARAARLRKQRTRRALLTLCLMLAVALVSIGGTIAWLTDKSETVENIFKPTDVFVSLNETLPQNKEAQMIPGVAIDKDPKVTAEGDVPYYLFVKVTKNNWNENLSYTIANGWTELDAVKYPGVYYKDMANGGKVENASVLAGDKVDVSAELTKDNMPDVNATLTFKAYVVQKQDGGADNSGNFTPVEAWETVGD